MADQDASAHMHIDPADIRWKMTVACDVCRRRKVRCDGERPCSRCVKSVTECTFSLPKHARRGSQHIQPPVKRSRTDSRLSEERRSTPVAESSLHAQRRIVRAHSANRNEKRPLTPIHPQSKEHLLLIDPDDQIVYSGPSSGMPLFARLGLLRTVEVSESAHDNSSELFTSHSSSALGITSAISASRDYFDMCIQRCPQELMYNLIGHHLESPVFFPLLHAPSFLAEFIAVTQRRLKCTPQYGAMLMAILAVTARLVDGARSLVPASNRAGEAYFEFAQDLLRVSKNKLDIRHIIALYYLGLYAEGRTASVGASSSFVAEAVGLAFATGLHRSTGEFKMDPVTGQIRTRLFWALYFLDTALACSQGRPSLTTLSECSVELPVIVDNQLITKTEILPQPDDQPAIRMASAVKMIEIYIVLEQVLSAINAPSSTIYQKLSLEGVRSHRSDRLARAEERLNEIQISLPGFLVQIALPISADQNVFFVESARVRSTLLFVRTLIARQRLVDEIETVAGQDKSDNSNNSNPSEATLDACRLCVEIIKTYSKLRHVGLLQYCSFNAVSHLTAASHTLIFCMLRATNLAYEHRPDLLTAIDILLVFARRFPCAESVAQLLVQLSHTLDFSATGSAGTAGNGEEGESTEALAIRVLARKMAVSPSGAVPVYPQERLNTSAPSTQQRQPERYDYDWLVKTASSMERQSGQTQTSTSNTANEPAHYYDSDHQILAQPQLREAPSNDNNGNVYMFSQTLSTGVEGWSGNQDITGIQGENGIVFGQWEDHFSFLNDGLFGAI